MASVIIRPMVKADLPFIFASWRNSLWFDKKRPEDQSEQFYRLATKEIGKLINKPSITCKVACMDDNADQIIGYAVLESEILHWVYVKLDYRKQGVARLLTKGFSKVYLPMTKIGQSIVNNRKLEVVHD